MVTVEVYQEDGTRQCGEGEEISLEKSQSDLSAIAGAGSIVEARKRVLPYIYPSVCGAKNGHTNFFVIDVDQSDDFLKKLRQGGFFVWPSEETLALDGGGLRAFGPGGDSFPFISPAEMISQLATVSASPSQIKDLIGYKLRIVKEGFEPRTMELHRNRVNMYVDGDDKIVDVSFW